MTHAKTDDSIIIENFKVKIRTHTPLIEAVFLWELNDSETRAKLQGMCEVFVYDVTGLGDYHEYEVVCDERNNTPEVIDANSIRLDLYRKRFINLGKWYNDPVWKTGFTLNYGGLIIDDAR